MAKGPGPAGEFFLTDAFQYMVDKGAKLKVEPVQGWYDAGKPETLLETNLHVLSTTRGKSPPAKDGVTVHEPVHVADGVELEACEIGPNVTLSAGAKVRNSRLRDCIVGEASEIDGCDLHDSLVGSNAVVRNVTGKVDVGDHSVVTNG
jgi:glucose-1-phosphate thymidylyltransferase